VLVHAAQPRVGEELAQREGDRGGTLRSRGRLGGTSGEGAGSQHDVGGPVLGVAQLQDEPVGSGLVRLVDVGVLERAQLQGEGANVEARKLHHGDRRGCGGGD
jgi:hypothetical protein